MKTLILVIAVVGIIFLLTRLRNKTDPETEACAKAVIELIRDNQAASPEEIAEVFRAHNRSSADIDQVTRLVAARLSQARVQKEYKPEVMQRVRQAKHLI